jgi:hypothetical protein
MKVKPIKETICEIKPAEVIDRLEIEGTNACFFSSGRPVFSGKITGFETDPEKQVLSLFVEESKIDISYSKTLRDYLAQNIFTK